jgi:hypothetical protein
MRAYLREGLLGRGSARAFDRPIIAASWNQGSSVSLVKLCFGNELRQPLRLPKSAPAREICRSSRFRVRGEGERQ